MHIDPDNNVEADETVEDMYEQAEQDFQTAANDTEGDTRNG